jgi:hypothetical protein
MKHAPTLPNNMIHIDDLSITQDGFRFPRQIQEMVELVASNGRFNLGALAAHNNGDDLRLINIARFEDGRHFIHDGHHRVAAIYLGGRKFVHANEYEVTDWKYEQYLEINLDKGWITPFDPRIELRVPDYTAYKQYVMENLKACGKESATAFIKMARTSYTRPRTMLTVQDLLRSL